MAREGPAAGRSGQVDDPHGRARAYWRHQLVLTLVAAAVVLAALIVVVVLTPMIRPPVSELRLGPDGRVEVARPSEEGFAAGTWPAVVGAVAVTTVLGALVVHTVRVATFTFRRGDR